MSALGRLGRRKDPRTAHAGILARDFSGLAGPLVDGFYANFGYAAPLSLVLHVQALCGALQPRLVVELGSGLTTAHWSARWGQRRWSSRWTRARHGSAVLRKACPPGLASR